MLHADLAVAADVAGVGIVVVAVMVGEPLPLMGCCLGLDLHLFLTFVDEHVACDLHHERHAFCLYMLWMCDDSGMCALCMCMHDGCIRVHLTVESDRTFESLGPPVVAIFCHPPDDPLRLAEHDTTR